MATKEKLNFRIEEVDRELFAKAAALHRETMTQFLVESGRERAERLLADRSSFTVGSEDWQGIMDAMDRPAKSRPALVDLFSRQKPE